VSERDAFLRAVRDHPDEDAPRLVFADWLDDSGDPLGEFIRVQFALEPHRQPLPDEHADARRKHRLARAARRDSNDPLAPLLRREGELLAAHGKEWAPGLIGVPGLSPQIRRGLVEEVWGGSEELLAHADRIADTCPALRRLVVHGPRGHGADLAACPLLGRLRELTLAGWPTTHDARALAASPHLRGLRTLRVWLSGRETNGRVHALATSPNLPALEAFVLVQGHGGVLARAEADRLAHEADMTAVSVHALAGRPVARVERPFDRLHPLDGDVGSGLFAGRIAGSSHPQSLLCVNRDARGLVHFDADGRLVAVEVLDSFPVAEADVACHQRTAELLAALHDALGFTPGVVFVREFYAPGLDLGVYASVWDDEVSDPDELGEEEREVAGSLHAYWMEGGNFAVMHDNDYWAGPDGTIHTS
jgi:uncharacterized protein (TIGR02996 family)